MTNFQTVLENVSTDVKATAATRARAYAEGFEDGVDRVMDKLRGMEPAPVKEHVADGRPMLDTFIYELCKELDVSSNNIRGNQDLSLDELATRLSDRIREAYAYGKG